MCFGIKVQRELMARVRARGAGWLLEDAPGLVVRSTVGGRVCVFVGYIFH